MAIQEREKIKFESEAEYLTAVLGVAYNPDFEEKDEIYKLIDPQELCHYADLGEVCYRYIVQRKSDGKYFSGNFTSCYKEGGFRVEEQVLTEVFPYQRTITIYI